jgi:hypothetical protein
MFHWRTRAGNVPATVGLELWLRVLRALSRAIGVYSRRWMMACNLLLPAPSFSNESHDPPCNIRMIRIVEFQKQKVLCRHTTVYLGLNVSEANVINRSAVFKKCHDSWLKCVLLSPDRRLQEMLKMLAFQCCRPFGPIRHGLTDALIIAMSVVCQGTDILNELGQFRCSIQYRCILHQTFQMSPKGKWRGFGSEEWLGQDFGPCYPTHLPL